MANRTAALYIRTKTGYKKHGQRLIDLPEGEVCRAACRADATNCSSVIRGLSMKTK